MRSSVMVLVFLLIHWILLSLALDFIMVLLLRIFQEFLHIYISDISCRVPALFSVLLYIMNVGFGCFYFSFHKSILVLSCIYPLLISHLFWGMVMSVHIFLLLRVFLSFENLSIFWLYIYSLFICLQFVGFCHVFIIWWGFLWWLALFFLYWFVFFCWMKSCICWDMLSIYVFCMKSWRNVVIHEFCGFWEYVVCSSSFVGFCISLDTIYFIELNCHLKRDLFSFWTLNTIWSF